MRLPLLLLSAASQVACVGEPQRNDPTPVDEIVAAIPVLEGTASCDGSFDPRYAFTDRIEYACRRFGSDRSEITEHYYDALQEIGWLPLRSGGGSIDLPASIDPDPHPVWFEQRVNNLCSQFLAAYVTTAGEGEEKATVLFFIPEPHLDCDHP